jgi:glycosyltransferase involved in cell wall biosynthesis
MVIAQVIGDLRIGGAERLFVDLVNSLEAESAFVVLLNASEVSLDLSDALSTSITVLRAPVRRRTFYVDVPKLAMLLRRLQCDIVHTHTFWSNLYGSAAAALAGVPVIVTSEHGRNEWKRPWHKWAESSVISRFADRRLCVSKDILARRRDIDGVPAQKLVLMPNGTRVPEMSEERHLDRMIIGSVGRLVPEKDFPTLVAAVSGLRKAGHDCYLEIVGEGSARGEIEAAICAEGLSDRVSLVGSQTDVVG